MARETTYAFPELQPDHQRPAGSNFEQTTRLDVMTNTSGPVCIAQGRRKNRCSLRASCPDSGRPARNGGCTEDGGVWDSDFSTPLARHKRGSQNNFSLGRGLDRWPRDDRRFAGSVGEGNTEKASTNGHVKIIRASMASGASFLSLALMSAIYISFPKAEREVIMLIPNAI